MTLDLLIGFIGIALAIITSLLPYIVPTMPGWVARTGIALAVVLIVFALGIFVGSRVTPQTTQRLSNRAELRLHFYGDGRTPTRISEENIWRWYCLFNSLNAVDTKTGQVSTVTITNLFVTFDNPVRVGTLEVTAGFPLANYEVKEFTNRYAIIAFSGLLPAGDLTVAVRQ